MRVRYVCRRREEESERGEKKEMRAGGRHDAERRGARRRVFEKLKKNRGRCLPEPRVEKLFRRRLLNGRRSFAEHSAPRCPVSRCADLPGVFFPLERKRESVRAALFLFFFIFRMLYFYR